jgi:uncharacterized protein YbbK (DUF523 family)
MECARRGTLLVSACLVGLHTRFDGGHNFRARVAALADVYHLVPVCPEQLGGLPTPRRPAEIRGGAGPEVLAGRARVFTPEDVDVTEAFMRGARAVLGIAELCGASGAVLKARSPSCGVGETYDGTFSRSLVQGSGVTASMLEAAGMALWTEEDVSAGRGPAGLAAGEGEAC